MTLMARQMMMQRQMMARQMMAAQAQAAQPRRVRPAGGASGGSTQAELRRQRLEERRQQRLERLQKETSGDLAGLVPGDGEGTTVGPAADDPFQFRIAELDLRTFAEKPLR